MIDTIVTAPGSLGDVNPMIAIARALQAGGRKVVLVAAERYLPLAERAGLQTRSLISEEVFSRAIDDQNLWHPRKGLKVIFGAAAQGFLDEHYDFIKTKYQRGKTLLVSHVLDFAGRVFRDAHPDVAFCSVVPAPALLRSLNEPPRLTRLGLEQMLPRLFVSMGYRYADRIIDSLAAPAINRLRARVHLPPVRRVLDRWWISPDLTLGLFPDWFSVPDIDLPSGMECVGFPLADSGDLLTSTSDQSNQEVIARLGEQKPIVFAPGSAHTHAKKFLAAAARACESLGLPGLLISSVDSQFPKKLPDNVFTANYMPFRQLLPRARAIVHHGGIGTTSQALAVGLPQLILPMAFDQFDNATRVEKLGCGRWMPMASATPRRMAKRLQEILNDPHVDNAVKRVAVRMSGQQLKPDYLAKIVLTHFSGQI